jgi:hypothetical protein
MGNRKGCPDEGKRPTLANVHPKIGNFCLTLANFRPKIAN